MKKMKYYYLGQPIRYFLGREFSVHDNWTAAYTFAARIVKQMAQRGINLYSPAAYTIPLAKAWDLDESEESRKLYFQIDHMFIEMMRKAGELIWIMHQDWEQSTGCRLEVAEARAHHERIIKFNPFYYNDEEIVIEQCELDQKKEKE